MRFFNSFLLLTLLSAHAQVITTIAGTDNVPVPDGTPAMQGSIGVFGITQDAAGNIYLCDLFRDVVMKVDTSGRLSRFAGNGIPVFAGDGGLAVNASLNDPERVVVDAQGNVYITEAGNHRVRKVAPDGIITTVAGNGVRGFGGDGGPATSASLNLPVGIALDAQGNLYIADYDNRRVRKVTPQGIISTVVGTGQSGFGGDGGPATQARINAFGVGISPAGELYIADTFNNRIRRVNAQGVISTVAGNGTAAFSGDGGPAGSASMYSPFAVQFDAQGNYFISDYANNRVRRVDLAGVITTVAGNGQEGAQGNGGPAAQANLNYPYSIYVTPSGTLLIADTFGFRVKRVVNGILTFIAGNGKQISSPDGVPASSALLSGPMGLAFDRNGDLLFADSFNRQIRRLRANGTVGIVAGTGDIGAGGDGGSALAATFKDPENVAVDQAGNIYIADTLNHRIRRVDTQGRITSIAGNGGVDCSPGANLPFRPKGMAFDTAGNLYFADDCHYIRRITPQGGMSIYAGTGQAGFANGPALQAQFNTPGRIAFDRAGNLYVADEFNHRIRRIDPQGNVTTIAGNGSAGNAGDGGPATSAQLSAPRGVAVDNNGNVLIADYSNHRVRIISGGRIDNFAGNGVEAWSGDGGPATQASVRRPEGLAVDSAGNVYLGDRGNNRIRQILAAPPSVQTTFGNETTITFRVKSGELSSYRDIDVRAAILGVGYQASVVGSWLEVQPDRGTTPARVRVRANAGALTPGNYRGSVVIRSPFGTPAERTIPVVLDVATGDPAKLVSATRSLTFSFVEGSEASSRALTVTNGGAGPVAFSAKVDSGSFLSLNEAIGTATQAQPVNLQVTANPTGLAPGTYTGAIRLDGLPGEFSNVPVTMTITPAQTKLVLSPAGLVFRAVAGAGSPLPQEIGIVNTGEGRMPWTAAAVTLSGSSAWLSLSSSSGAVANPLVDASTVEVRVNQAGLAPGDYYGRVDVTSPGNTKQTVSVLLSVLPVATVLPPEVRPTGLVFTAAQGSNPPAQTLRIGALGTATLNFDSSRSTLSGGNWFAHLPVGGQVTPGSPVIVTVQPVFEGLAPGTYQGSLSFQFSDGTSQSVNILAIVAAADSGVSDSGFGDRDAVRAANGCAPARLSMLLTTPRTVNAKFGEPSNLGVRVLDDCGQAVTSTTKGASVRVSFAPQAQPTQAMDHIAQGSWTATIQSRTVRTGTITASITAFVALPNGRILADQADVQVNVSDSIGAPVIAPGAVLNGASFAADTPLAPGTIITLKGAGLADSDRSALGLAPAPLEFNDVQVRLGDRPLPLFYVGREQINAQVPFDLPLNTQQQILVRKGSTLSVPERFTVGPAQPAVFTRDQNGVGQGAIVNGVTNVLADTSNPVRVGDVISIYCTGLGLVSPTVQEGEQAPSNVLSRTVGTLRVTIGGRDAIVQFSGLAPGFVGLYQVNAFIPEGVSGDDVPIVLETGGQRSSPVTIAVR